MTANPWRGEEEIILDGQRYILRPTFEALRSIEQDLDTGIVAIAGKLAAGKATLEELAAMITHCLQAELSALEVKEALVRGAIAHATQKLAAMLAKALGELHDHAP